jgi:hypothetical protein
MQNDSACFTSAFFIATMRVRMKPYISIAIISLILFSCSNHDSDKRSFRWYAIDSGKFHSVPDIERLKKPSFLPWTIQERVSDIAYDSGKIVIGINGYGVAFLEEDKGTNQEFHYFFDRALFSERTLTMLLPFGDEICCHFYINTSLGAGPAGKASRAGCNFAFFPAQGVLDRFMPYILPSETDQDGYEAVGFLPATKIDWYIEWKKAGAVTRFRYSQYEMSGSRETAISREQYRDAYSFKNVNLGSVPRAIKLLAREIKKRDLPDAESTSYHFLTKDKETNLVTRYESKGDADPRDDSFEIRNVFMFIDERNAYALSDKAILWMEQASTDIHEIELPAMPDGFRYTGLFVSDRSILLSFEESSFFKTGNAGLLVIER